MKSINDTAIETAQMLLAKCAANDPWFPQPAQSTVMAWAEQIMLTNLNRQQLLDGVTKAYATEKSGFKPLAADIITHARNIRQDQLDRQGPETPPRQALEARCDDKAGFTREPINKAAPDDYEDNPYPSHWTAEQRVAEYWRRLDAKYHPERTHTPTQRVSDAKLAIHAYLETLNRR